VAMVLLPSWGFAEGIDFLFDLDVSKQPPTYVCTSYGNTTACSPHYGPYIPQEAPERNNNRLYIGDQYYGNYGDNYQYTPPTDYYLYDQTPTLPEQSEEDYENYDYYKYYKDPGDFEGYAPKGALENSEAPIFKIPYDEQFDDEPLIPNIGVKYYKFENGKLIKID